MSYLLIEDFKEGLDTRKSLFTAAPGSLRECVNAHITRGGELEKRKAFIQYAALPANTFGMLRAGKQLYVFGTAAPPTMPPGVLYQQCVPSAAGINMTGVLSADTFAGKPFIVATFDDGSSHAFYNGVQVTSLDSLLGSYSSNSDVAAGLFRVLRGQSTLTPTVTGTTITVVGSNHGAFTYSASAPANASITPTLVTSYVAPVAEKLAQGSITFTPAGTSTACRIDSLTIGGTELLPAPVTINFGASGYPTNPYTLVDTINNYQSTYVCGYNSAVKGQFSFTGATGTGATLNGQAIAASASYGVSSVPMIGGVNAVAEQSQVVTFDVGGTFTTAGSYTITINGTPYTIASSYHALPSFCYTYGDKMYVIAGSLLFFSGFTGTPARADPTAFATDGSITGSGVIDMSTQENGEEQLVAIATYQNYLAIFSEQTIYIWSMDADPAKNQKMQALPNIGTLAPQSVYTYGEHDVFFLSQSGLRSLRVRNMYNLAGSDDVGSAIDNGLLTFLNSLSPKQRTDAASVVDPISGRYWLSVAGTIYVFTHFMGSGIAAWTTYDPGMVFERFDTLERQIYGRSGNAIYVYGGLSGMEYDASKVTIKTPYMDASDPGTQKTLHALDVGCENHWSIQLGVDPTRPQVLMDAGELDGATYGLSPSFPIEGWTTHFSLVFEHARQGEAKLENCCIHYSKAESD